MFMRRQLAMLLPAAMLADGRLNVVPPPQPVVANDNRRPAGRMERDTLVLRLTVTPASWHILGENEPAFTVLAFAEDGKPPTIPGPLIRVRVGTPVQVWLRNPLADTLIVRGLGEGVAIRDSILVFPGETASVRFVARSEGNYLYWAVSAGLHALGPLPSPRRGYDSQLGGAIVVDPPGRTPDDRIFVITEIADRRAGRRRAGSKRPPRNTDPAVHCRQRQGMAAHRTAAVRARRLSPLAPRQRQPRAAPDAPPRVLLPRGLAWDVAG